MTAQIGQLVRSLLVDDLESYAEQTAQLDEHGWNAFSETVGAAFYRAVANKFGTIIVSQPADPDADPDASADDPASAELSGFVSEAAEPYAGTAVAIDLVAAEALVRSVLGDEASVAPVLDELDEPDLARIELVLLKALVADGSHESVEELISGAEGEAAAFSGDSSPDVAAENANAGTDDANVATDGADDAVGADGAGEADADADEAAVVDLATSSAVPASDGADADEAKEATG